MEQTRLAAEANSRPICALAGEHRLPRGWQLRLSWPECNPRETPLAAGSARSRLRGAESSLPPARLASALRTPPLTRQGRKGNCLNKPRPDLEFPCCSFGAYRGSPAAALQLDCAPFQWRRQIITMARVCGRCSRSEEHTSELQSLR